MAPGSLSFGYSYDSMERIDRTFNYRCHVISCEVVFMLKTNQGDVSLAMLSELLKHHEGNAMDQRPMIVPLR